MARANPRIAAGAAAGYDLSKVNRRLASCTDGKHRWAAGWTEASVEERLSYTDWKGNPWISPIWQIALHVVNHGTHHRGQVAGFLRTMGYAPPPLDPRYYRTL